MIFYPGMRKGQIMEKFFSQLIERRPELSAVIPEIRKCAQEMVALFRRKGTFFVAGNGGSGMDGEHICGELLKGFVSHRELSDADKAMLAAADPEKGVELGKKLQYGLPAISLLSHPGLLSAFGNDVDSDCAFAQQLWALGRSGDIFMGISTSGNAANIRLALAAARAKGIKTVLLTGNRHGCCEALADIIIAVPESETYRIQELHLPVYHTLCIAVESQFFDIDVI